MFPLATAEDEVQSRHHDRDDLTNSQRYREVHYDLCGCLLPSDSEGHVPH